METFQYLPGPVFTQLTSIFSFQNKIAGTGCSNLPEIVLLPHGAKGQTCTGFIQLCNIFILENTVI